MPLDHLYVLTDLYLKEAFVKSESKLQLTQKSTCVLVARKGACPSELGLA